jgi:glycosyltransferase, group 2 family
MKKLLTIIIPLYNVEQYIRKCIESIIVPQEYYNDLEVIIINDGTPDNSAIIAKEYESKYPEFIKVIDKENGGHGSTWNLGLQMAQGKYIRFLDSDDWFDKKNFITFLNKLRSSNSDLIFTNAVHLNIKDLSVIQYINFSHTLREGTEYDAETIVWNEIGGSESLTNFHTCTYKTELFKPLLPLFLEKQSYDDAILFIAPVIVCKTISFFDLLIYNYILGYGNQSMSKENLRKNYPQFTKLIKSQNEMVKKYEHTLSKTKKEKVHQVLNTMIIQHFERLSYLPYDEAKNQLKDWTEYLNTQVGQYKQSKKMKLYNCLPFALYKGIIDITSAIKA